MTVHGASTTRGQSPKSIKVFTVRPLLRIQESVYGWELTLTCFGLIMSSQQQLLDVTYDPLRLNSTALILSGYDPSDPYSPQQSAKCELQALWPAIYGDVYFFNGCLYDSDGNIIFNQCCSTPDINHSGLTVNPYYDPRSAASCQQSFGPDNSLSVDTTIYLKGSWITDNGDALYKQLQARCRAVAWVFGPNTDIETDGSSARIGQYESQYQANFSVSSFSADSCVGQAIASAGGPEGVVCDSVPGDV